MRPPASALDRARRVLSTAVAGGLLLALLAACLPSASPPLTARQIASQSAARMVALRSLHFTIEVKGASKPIDPLGQLLLRRAEGDVVRPDRAQSRIRVALAGVIVEIQAISIGDTLWLTNPVTRRWEQAPPGWSYNPAVLFDSRQGLTSLLERAALERAPDESLDGKAHYRLTGELAGSELAPMTAGMITGAVRFTLWIGADDFLLRRVHLTESGPGSEPTEWDIVLSGFERPVTIEPPLP